MDKTFNSGDQVSLVRDPGKIGTLTGRFRERLGKKMFLVRFPSSTEFVAEHDLRKLDDEPPDAFDMLEERRFGRLNDFRRTLTHIQLSGKLANIVYSMDTTNTEFYAYQYKPVLSFLDAPSKGILIADEVGLGKTIEAGLIWTELRARFDMRRLLIVCPAVLREKWSSELQYRFGIDADICNAAELLKKLQQHDRPRSGKAVICSYDGIRPPRDAFDDESNRSSGASELAKFLNDKTDDADLFDLVIFDEAHKMRNVESSTSKLGRLLRDVATHVLLLSATPINLRNDDLYQLLNIVDEDTFNNPNVFPDILRANEPLVRAQKIALDRSKSWADIIEPLEDASQHQLLRNNEQLASLIMEGRGNTSVLSDAERIQLANRIIRSNLLSRTVTRTRKRDVKEFHVIREAKAPQVLMTDNEQLLYNSVTEIVRSYAIEQEISEGFLLATPQRQLSSSMYAAVRSWQGLSPNTGLSDEVYEDFGVDDASNERKVAPLMQMLARRLHGQIDIDDLRGNDSKYNEFIRAIKKYQKEYPDKKIIVFSYFRATLNYLAERLNEDQIANEVLMGGMKTPKHEILERFEKSSTTKVLLTSEVASEGVDLQFCSLLINYDLPWNPMRIEQRIGRIDRHGQKEPVIKILNFCYQGSIDERIYTRLFERLDIFQKALGDIEAILGDKINQLTRALFSHKLTAEQENEQIEQTALAIENLKAKEEELEKHAENLVAHSEHILEKVKAAHVLSKHVTERDLVTYVKDYLERHVLEHVFKKVDDKSEVYDIKLPANLAVKLQTFVRHGRHEGLTRLDQGQIVRCLFSNKVFKQNNSHEIINQTHPLIQFINKELIALHEARVPLIAMKVPLAATPKGFEKGIYAGSVVCWEFQGIRVEEVLSASIMNIDSERLIETELSLELLNKLRFDAEDWPEVITIEDTARIENAIDQCDHALMQSYEREFKFKKSENSDRVNLQQASLEQEYQREMASLEQTLKSLREKGNTNVIKATEGRITKRKERYQVRLETLEAKKREFSSHNPEVFKVVLKVY